MDAQQTAAVSDTGVTFHNYFKIGDNSGTPIDFLFFSKDLFEINKFEICRDRRIDNNGALSDHYQQDSLSASLKYIRSYILSESYLKNENVEHFAFCDINENTV